MHPADAVYIETVQEEVDENEVKVIDNETLVNLSMKVLVSKKMCGAKLVRSNSGSALEEEDLSVKHKKAKLSQIVASGSSHPLKQQTNSPELPHKLPTRSRQESNILDEGSDVVIDGVHTNMFGINFVMY